MTSRNYVFLMAWLNWLWLNWVMLGDWPDWLSMYDCLIDFQFPIDLRCWQSPLSMFDSSPVICNVAKALNGLTRLECITVRKQGALGQQCACWVLMTQTVPHQDRACCWQTTGSLAFQMYPYFTTSNLVCKFLFFFLFKDPPCFLVFLTCSSWW